MRPFRRPFQPMRSSGTKAARLGAKFGRLGTKSGLIAPTAGLVIWIASGTIAATQTAAGSACDTASSTVELNRCSERDLQSADAKLNDMFQFALTAIKENGGDKPYDAKSWEAALRASQRAWIVFRDADCKDLVPKGWGGGTGTTSAVLGCLTSKTTARTKELQDLFEIN